MDEVVVQVLAGDKDVFHKIVQEYGPSVRACLASRLRNPEATDDLAQETFIAAYESLAQFRPGADMNAWLKGIARNKLLMHLRSINQHGTAVERLKAGALQEVDAQVERLSERDDAGVLQRLAECLERLPQRLRTVITARYYRHEKVFSIADRLGTSDTAISSLLYRGRKQLEACIQESR